MFGLTTMEIGSICLNMIFNCTYTYLLFSVYSERKKPRFVIILATCLYYPVLVASEICSLVIYKGHPQIETFRLVFFFAELAICFWPLFLSNFYNRKLFDSQFLAYFTNSMNPFLYAASLLSRFVTTKLDFPTHSVQSVLIDRPLFILGIIVFVPIVKKYIVPRIERIPQFIVKGLVILVPVSQIIPFIANNRNNDIFNSNLFYLIFLAFGLTCCISAIVLYKYTIEITKREQLELLLKFEENKSGYFEALEQQTRKTSQLSHDITNHLRTIQSLALSQQKNELIEYSRSLTEHYSENLKAFCKNSIVNAMLLYYDSLAEKSKTTFSASAHISNNIQIPDVNLVSIISNILDNAFEACANLPENNRLISLNLNADENSLSCICENSYDGNINSNNSKFVSRKKDKTAHGLGTEIIKETTNKLNGTYAFDYTEDKFTVTIYIPF